MKKASLFIIGLLLAGVSFAQEGFFKVYVDNEMSFHPSAAVEAADGGFITAVYDDNGKGELVKMSADGAIVNRVAIDLAAHPSFNIATIDKIYRDHTGLDAYLAVGFIMSWEREIARPFVIRFDEDLNISFRKVIKLPDEYTCYISKSWLLTRDGNFLCASTVPENKMFYFEVTPEGEVVKVASESIMDPYLAIGTLFEFPENGQYGHYRVNRIPGGGHPSFFNLDENLHSELVRQYEFIPVDTINNYVYSLHIEPIAHATAVLLDENTFLFSDKTREDKLLPNQVGWEDWSTLLFKTNLEGDIQSFHVVGSWNDTIETPAALQSFDIVRNATETAIYSCSNRWIGASYDVSSLSVTKMEESLDEVWYKTFSHPNYALQSSYVLATSDGGCLVVGEAIRSGRSHLFALKLNSEGTVGTDEIIVRDGMIFYPNPVKDRLHLKCPTASQPQSVQLYDMQGRLVRSQGKGLESINMEGLPAGIYTMRVMLEGGKVYSDKVVKE